MRKSLRVALMVAVLVLSMLAGDAMSVFGASKYVIGTAGTAGMCYPIGAAIAAVWSREMEGVSVTPQVTGGSVENCRLLGLKEVEFGLVMGSIAEYAYNGTELFEGQPIKNIRGVASLVPEILQNLVKADSGISSISELRGKRVSVGPPGSGNLVSSKELLESYGITLADIKPFYLSYAETANHFKDRLIDCAMFITGLGTSAIQDIAMSQDVRLLSMTEEEVANLIAQNPLLVPFVIPAGTYKGQDEDVLTATLLTGLYCRDDADEDFVYHALETLYDNLEDLARSHAMGKMISLEIALSGMTVPLHPGAEKYYREKGLIK